MPTIFRDLIALSTAAVCTLTIAACDSTETDDVSEDQAPATQAPVPQPEAGDGEGDGEIALDATITVEGVRIGIPGRWRIATPGSGFTAAQYTVPGADASQDATFTISNPIGGGLMYNTLRWDRQFRGEEAETKSWVVLVDDLQIMEFEGRGDFDSGLPGSTGPQESMAVLGAVPIVNGPEQIEPGDSDDDGRYAFTIDQEAQPMRLSNIFIKMTGPAETVDAARAEWDALLNSIRIRDVSSWATP